MAGSSFALLYGTGMIEFSMPQVSNVTVIRKPILKDLPDPEAALQAALAKPVNAPPLERLAAGKGSACIVISDNTRPVPNELLLHGIVERLTGSVSEIHILIANGLHMALDADAIKGLVGDRIAGAYDIHNHSANTECELAELDVSPQGVPISLNRRFLESDLRILTGLVEPHFMAGFSGGRKSVCPGIADRRTIQWLHGPDFLEDPRADLCVLKGNPVHKEALHVARRAGVDFIVNVALDESRQLAKVAAGNLVDAWMECVRFVSRNSQVEIGEAFDVIITSNGGYPQDRNFYQAVKGLVSAKRILKRNGIIIMASECRDGLGSVDFQESLAVLKAAKSADRYIDFISQKEGNVAIDQWEAEELAKALRLTSRVFLLSKGLTDLEMEFTLAERVASVEEAMQKTISILGSKLRVAVIPSGPYVVGSCRGEGGALHTSIYDNGSEP